MSEPTREEMVKFLDYVWGILPAGNYPILEAIRKHLEKQTVSREWIEKIVEMLSFQMFPKQPFHTKSWFIIVEYVATELGFIVEGE